MNAWTIQKTSRLRIELTSRDAGLNVGPSELGRPDRQIQEMKRDEHQDQLSIHIVEISLPFKVAFNFFCWMLVMSQFGLRTHFWHLHVWTKASQLCFEALKPSWGWKNLQSILETAFNLLIWKIIFFKNGLSLSLVGFHVSFASTESSIKVIFNLICRQRCFFCFGRCCRCLKLKLIGRVLSFHLRGIDPVIVEREWERKKTREWERNSGKILLIAKIRQQEAKEVKK